MNSFEYLYEEYNKKINYDVKLKTEGNWKIDEQFITSDPKEIVNRMKSYCKEGHRGHFVIIKGDDWDPVDKIRYEYTYDSPWNKVKTTYVELFRFERENWKHIGQDEEVIDDFEKYLVDNENAIVKKHKLELGVHTGKEHHDKSFVYIKNINN